MNNLLFYKNKFENLLNKKVDLRDEIIIAFFEQTNIEQQIKQWNKDRQFSGQTIENKPIVPLYAQSTIKYKKRKNQVFTRVTLRDKGDYHNSFAIEVNKTKQEIVIYNNDKKAIYLEKKYSDKIIGLSNNELAIVINLLYIFTINYLKTWLSSYLRN